MKLLFDQNLSPRLVTSLRDLFPGSAHVFPLGLDRVDDRQIWDFAKAEGFTVVSKDFDFASMSLVLGAPPKVVWIARGNCSAPEVEAILRSAAQMIVDFAAVAEETYLLLT